ERRLTDLVLQALDFSKIVISVRVVRMERQRSPQSFGSGLRFLRFTRPVHGFQQRRAVVVLGRETLRMASGEHPQSPNDFVGWITRGEVRHAEKGVRGLVLWIELHGFQECPYCVILLLGHVIRSPQSK